MLDITKENKIDVAEKWIKKRIDYLNMDLSALDDDDYYDERRDIRRRIDELEMVLKIISFDGDYTLHLLER